MNISEIEQLVMIAQKYKLARLLVDGVDIVTTPYTYMPPEPAAVAVPNRSFESIMDDPDLFPEN